MYIIFNNILDIVNFTSLLNKRFNHYTVVIISVYIIIIIIYTDDDHCIVVETFV